MLKWRFCAFSLLLLLITACGTENQPNSSSNTASSPDAGRLQTVKNFRLRIQQKWSTLHLGKNVAFY